MNKPEAVQSPTFAVKHTSAISNRTSNINFASAKGATELPCRNYQGLPVLTSNVVQPRSLENNCTRSRENSLASNHSEQWFANSLLYTGDERDAPMPHYVLLPLGKTGDGKSSLLNAMFGYNEFKAASSARSVTSSITERTGVWSVSQGGDAMITVADTPGFGDSDGRDPLFQMQIKEYIEDLSDRLGIDAFLLVFKYNSPRSVDMVNLYLITDFNLVRRIMSILQKFADMMKDLKPGWWDHVILVFTCVDYSAVQRPQITSKKLYITTQLVEDIKKTFGLAEAPPVAFVTSASQMQCAFLTGKGECDCIAAHKHKLDKMRLLKKHIASRAEFGRW